MSENHEKCWKGLGVGVKLSTQFCHDKILVEFEDEHDHTSRSGTVVWMMLFYVFLEKKTIYSSFHRHIFLSYYEKKHRHIIYHTTENFRSCRVTYKRVKFRPQLFVSGEGHFNLVTSSRGLLFFLGVTIWCSNNALI